MKYLAALCLVCFFFLNPGRLPAQTHDELIERYMGLSGVDDALVSFPAQLKASMAQQPLVFQNPEMETRVLEILLQAYDLSVARENLKGYLRDHTDPAFFRELLQWLETPLARHISAEEKSASDPDSQPAMMSYINELRAIPPSPERIALIREVEDATQISSMTTRIVLVITRGALKSFNKALPPEKREPEEKIEAQLKRIRPRLKEAFRKQMTLSSYYTYRNISDEDLAAYIDFYRSDLGRKEIRTTGNALSQVLEQWFAAAGKEIADLVKEMAEKKKREMDARDSVPQTKAL